MIAVGIGLLAPLIVLKLPDLEALASRNPAAVSLHSTAPQALVDKVDTALYDYLFFVRGPHAQGARDAHTSQPIIPQVVIVTISENDIQTVKDLYPGVHARYPFPRRVYGDLIHKLKDAGATVIGLDIFFTTPSGYNRSENDPDDDAAFASALKQCGNVVLASAFGLKNTDSGSVGTQTFIVQSQDFPIPMLRKSARAVSPVNLPKDSLDNYVRRFHLYMTGPDDPDLPLGEKPYGTFAPTIAMLHAQAQRDSHTPDEQSDRLFAAGLQQGRFAGSPLPFHPEDAETGPDDSRSVNICFAGFPGATTDLHGIGAVLDPQNAGNLKAWFGGKIALVGTFIKSEQDFVRTPLIARLAEKGTGNAEADVRYGVEVHANIIHTLLSRHIYRDFDESRRIALVWMCGLVTALLVVRLRPVFALVPIIILMSVIAALIVFSFQRYVFLRPVQIGLATVLAYGLESVYFYSVEDRRARQARSTFQRYVGPQVMERVLDTDFKPGTVEQRNLTIMFTDVQGFTSLSEKMTPREVVETFNRYLNEMVELIDKHGGTLDKIMGDGVMAYFNAPLPLQNHERRAVECALDMQTAMRSWRELSQNLGLPPLKVRIGINCGDVVFGEVGAKRQLGYTVIGDAVNAAARLEPLNKEFGTEILISEAVRDHLDDTFETQYVGKLTIRGREEGIRAYSVVGRK